MITFENGALTIDTTLSVADSQAIHAFADTVRNGEQERIIKLLEEHIPIEDNYNMESGCRGCDWEWAWMGEVNDSHENHLIALIKGEK